MEKKEKDISRKGKYHGNQEGRRGRGQQEVCLDGVVRQEHSGTSSSVMAPMWGGSQWMILYNEWIFSEISCLYI